MSPLSSSISLWKQRGENRKLRAIKLKTKVNAWIDLCVFFIDRLMTPGSEIRFVHKHMGLVPGWGGGARLVRIVGSGAALQLLSGAVRVEPERARSLGLSEATLLSSEETRALGEARAWLSQYTEGPAAVIRAVKKVVAAGRELPLEVALRTEKDIFGTVWGGPANLQALVRRPKHK